MTAETLTVATAKPSALRRIGKAAFVVFLSIFFVSWRQPSGNALRNTYSANVRISNVMVGAANAAEHTRMITFDIGWDFSWRTSAPPYNWDAAWVFIKYQVGGGEWNHATLSAGAEEHVSPSGTTVAPPSDGKGVFLYRSEDGTGTFQSSGVSLKWNYGLDHIADDAAVNVKVLGVVMVYIPEGAFYVGDNGASDASLTKGSNDNRPWFIAGEDAIEVTNAASDGYYYRSSKDVWNDVWNAGEDVTGTEFTIPADFPKGFRAIYCMKYELTQQQYADFLNTLGPAQMTNRYGRSNFNHFGYSISENNGVYSTAHPERACGFLSPADGHAYADWAGIRPMTELEFEKICRGSGNPPVNHEFAWGTTYSKNARATGSDIDRLLFTIFRANSWYMYDEEVRQFPLNSGIFTWPGKSRELSGAAYYGVMEMSTNLSEPCVSIGNRYGRVFTWRNGDGQLAPDGFTDEINWPLRDGKGGGYRGGCFANERGHMCTSVRVEATLEIDNAHRHIPWGFRGVRTILN